MRSRLRMHRLQGAEQVPSFASLEGHDSVEWEDNDDDIGNCIGNSGGK